jgi:hypothetical protein
MKATPIGGSLGCENCKTGIAAWIVTLARRGSRSGGRIYVCDACKKRLAKDEAA